MKRIKKLPPLPYVLIFIICSIVVLAWVFFTPPESSPYVAEFHRGMLVFLIVSLLLVWDKFLRQGPPCCLFYGPEKVRKYDDEENEYYYEIRELSCGKPSVGAVPVQTALGTWYKHYFCKDHDPEIPWMRQWLAKKEMIIDARRIRRLRSRDC